MTLNRLVGALGLMLVLAHCGDDDSNADSTGDQEVDELRDEAYRILCSEVLKPEVGGEGIGLIKWMWKDTADCEENFPKLISDVDSGGYGRLQALIDAGRVEYNSAQVSACIATQEQYLGGGLTSVGFGDFEFAACREIAEGAVPEAGVCVDSYECAGDAYCDFEDSSTCGGVCKPRKALGQTCGQSDECVAANDIGWCRGGTCVEYVGGTAGQANEPCGIVAADATQVTLIVCDEGLFCDVTENNDLDAEEDEDDNLGVCRAPYALDATCNSGDDVCADQAFCVDGQCTAWTLREEAGESCDIESFTLCNLFNNLVCSGGQCQSVGDGNEGSTCQSEIYDLSTVQISCDGGLVCHYETLTCGAPKADGVACKSDSECQQGFCDVSGPEDAGVCGSPLCI